jgi:hypothetical protein
VSRPSRPALGFTIVGFVSNPDNWRSNMRRLLAYVVVSHTDILVIGLFTLLGHTAFQGGIPLAVNFGLASLGVPGTNGFPAEFLILLSALKTHTGAGFVALAAMILTAAYFLGIFRKTFLGPATSSVVTEAVDLRPRELTLATVLCLLILGLFAGLVLDLTRHRGAGLARWPRAFKANVARIRRGKGWSAKVQGTRHRIAQTHCGTCWSRQETTSPPMMFKLPVTGSKLPTRKRTVILGPPILSRVILQTSLRR